MAGEEDKGFRVIDRRGATEEAGEKKEDATRRGEGFVMNDKPESADAEKVKLPDQIDFSTLVFSLATGAFIHMGLSPDPATKQTEKSLPLAKQNIDILSLLQEKTKGNLTDDEQKLLENLLTEVRLRFVEASHS
jgi:hypothetical protein